MSGIIFMIFNFLLFTWLNIEGIYKFSESVSHVPSSIFLICGTACPFSSTSTKCKSSYSCFSSFVIFLRLIFNFKVRSLLLSFQFKCCNFFLYFLILGFAFKYLVTIFSLLSFQFGCCCSLNILFKYDLAFCCFLLFGVVSCLFNNCFISIFSLPYFNYFLQLGDSRVFIVYGLSPYALLSNVVLIFN